MTRSLPARRPFVSHLHGRVELRPGRPPLPPAKIIHLRKDHGSRRRDGRRPGDPEIGRLQKDDDDHEDDDYGERDEYFGEHNDGWSLVFSFRSRSFLMCGLTPTTTNDPAGKGQRSKKTFACQGGKPRRGFLDCEKSAAVGSVISPPSKERRFSTAEDSSSGRSPA